MKTFQTMDCVFNEIILCNWVWHWKQCKKFLPGLFPNIVVKTNILIFSPKSKLRLGPPTIRLLSCVARCWVDELRTPRPSDQIWPGIRKPWTRGRIMEIQSVWNWKQVEPPGKVRISNEQPGVVNSLKLFSPIMSEREKKYSWEIHLWKPWDWLKNKLGFPIMFFEKRPLRYNFTPYQDFTIWNVFYHPHLHIYPPAQAAIPHIARRTSGIYIKSHQMYSSPVHTQPGLKREIGPPTGL